MPPPRRYRVRLGTLMLFVIIAAMAIALVVQERRHRAESRRRTAQLVSAIEARGRAYKAMLEAANPKD